jgi:hypothetical protein
MHGLDKWEWLDEARILETRAEETKARETKAEEIKAKKTKVKKAKTKKGGATEKGMRGAKFDKETRGAKIREGMCRGNVGKGTCDTRLRSLRKLIGWGSDVRLPSASWLCCGVAVLWNYTFPSEDLVTKYRPVNLVQTMDFRL